MARAWVGLFALVCSGCVGPSYGPSHYPYSFERPSTRVYYYSEAPRSEARRSRDRYECYRWAKRKTGFDPSAPNLAPHHRIGIARQSPAESNALKGAFLGALLGAFAGAPEHAGEGAAIGAVAGAAIGAARDVDVARAEAARRSYERQRHTQLERRAEGYRRALAACLEGRGYTVE